MDRYTITLTDLCASLAFLIDSGLVFEIAFELSSFQPV